MLKKITVTLAFILLMILVLQQAVMAAVLEVDTASPAFKSDTWEVGADYVFSIDKAFSTTHTAGAGDGEQAIERFCACLENGADGVEGQLSFINGSAVNNAVFPFKETVRIDSVTWKWNNGVRQYFFVLYTSMDGQNWTEVEITNNAKKVTIENTWDENSSTDGPPVQCWASVPAGINDETDDINPITFTFKQTPDAKYFKIAAYGNDQGNDDLAVHSPWFSFNNMVFEGIIAPPAEVAPAAVEEAAPAVDNTPAPEAPAPAPAVVAPPAPAAPKTGDSAVIFAILTALTGVCVITKRTGKNKA